MLRGWESKNKSTKSFQVHMISTKHFYIIFTLLRAECDLKYLLSWQTFSLDRKNSHENYDDTSRKPSYNNVKFKKIIIQEYMGFDDTYVKRNEYIS